MFEERSVLNCIGHPFHILIVEKIESVRKERGVIVGFTEKRSLSPQGRSQSPGKPQMTAEQLRQQQASRAAALIEMVSDFRVL